MAYPQRRPTQSPVARRSTSVVESRFTPVRTHVEFDFGKAADRVLERRRAIAIVFIAAAGAIGTIGVLAYVAGLLAAAITVGLLGGLVAIGNWALNNSIHL